ncbi:MAG: sodium/proton antiporter NhaB [Gammaproteobacteria bacterium]|nr:sodium/proton antiporter NhaB [Gammaproteobacteria bacterium]
MASINLAQAFTRNFLGQSPAWYKATIVGFLILNPILVASTGSFFTGWVLIAEFIFCLAMALKCYPLQPGGLLAIEAVILGMTSAEAVYAETVANFPVIMLLMFMVAGIYFLKELLLFTFTKVLLKIRSKIVLSLLFCAIAAVLSAFLDALTVTAVVITVAEGFYLVYHKIASGKQYHDDHDHNEDRQVGELARADLVEFRSFLRGLMMHAAVGTALGGVMTLVGEPQNLLIAKVAGWEFAEFFIRMAPVSIPVFFVGLLTCMMLEKTRTFGFGSPLPENVRIILVGYDANQTEKRTTQDVAKLYIQAFTVLFLVVALGFHLAEVGVVGLTVIVLATAFNGITEEHRIGHAFEEALPFTSLLVVFFGIVAVIHDQHLFSPVIDWVLQLDGKAQTAAFYLANGFLSMISDNVFVATVYITEIAKALADNTITREQFDLLAVAINTGTNIPSVATPNGQAAFLFLLTSALAPLIRLSYGRMVWMALPYTVTMTITGLAAVWYLL